MEKPEKFILLRIITGSIILALLLFYDPQGWLGIILFLVPYFICGFDVLLNAFKNIFKGYLFDENFLMSIATIGAFIIGEYPEAVFVMIFYKIGELFEHIALGKSRKSISELMDIQSEFANIEFDGEIKKVSPKEVQIGDIIVIKPGEKIPLDGIVIEGFSSLNTISLTGESAPRDVSEGTEVISGCINISHLLKVKVSKLYKDSTVAKILDLIENSSLSKAKTENFITKFARVYTPFVVLFAAIIAIIPSVITGNFSEWIYRALIFLVISCPCALVISVPLAYFGGIGNASRKGILIKGSNYLEALANTGIIVFDKTGTLTKGVFKVTTISPFDCSEEELIKTAALAENFSNHPAAEAVKSLYNEKIDLSLITSTEEIHGKGVICKINSDVVYVGNSSLMNDYNIRYFEPDNKGTIIHVSKNSKYMGYFVISDIIKENSKTMIESLDRNGYKRLILLSGDRKDVVENTGDILGIREVYSELLPDKKVEYVEKFLSEKAFKTSLVYIGDGTNDAPVLSRADVGIAMGALGSDAAIEAADIVLMDDDPVNIINAINIAKKTHVIVLQTIIFALGVKFFILFLGAFGFANMGAAIFADVGVAVIAILNAMRTLRIKHHN